jgi:hypothetical protein
VIRIPYQQPARGEIFYQDLYLNDLGEEKLELMARIVCHPIPDQSEIGN